MSKGIIVRMVRDRGFGFIREDSGGDIFFHASGVTGVVPFDSLDEGQDVYYERTNDSRGRGERAVYVQVA